MKKAWLRIAVGAALLSAGCSPSADSVAVDVAPAPRVPARVQVAHEVGRLLSADEDRSRAAARRLGALDGEDRERLLSYVATLGGERDLRLLDVLDELHALPEMPVDEELDFLLWKSARGERYYGMKARSRLLDVARRDPRAVMARLLRGGRQSEVLAVTLGLAEVRAAIPALLRLYRHPGTQSERSAAAEALGLLAGDERRPRASGTAEEIGQDAEALEAWYREQLEVAEERSAGASGAATGGAR